MVHFFKEENMTTLFRNLFHKMKISFKVGHMFSLAVKILGSTVESLGFLWRACVQVSVNIDPGNSDISLSNFISAVPGLMGKTEKCFLLGPWNSSSHCRHLKSETVKQRMGDLSPPLWLSLSLSVSGSSLTLHLLLYLYHLYPDLSYSVSNTLTNILKTKMNLGKKIF